ncbi:beta-galactosidase [Paenibacillus albiflavus]|uniref:Beta-galactosidase n=1 Tax=Paenibacillus albiflavus TaxID=2545760 RepID=A0A4R4E8K4_9BACL|nr:beta-galactosidase family protein [Paenibacillus albiflavus]TCZ76124.1 beta-galactosidase [Paenibacillus albiflavus]
MATFRVEQQHFLYNEERIQLISGAIHYFRVVPAYWKDRLLKLKACGFNTVETYVAWNVHERVEGQFNFEGMADVVSFIQLAGELGLHVIVRPSPYICAEWEFGGMPAWLLADPGMQLRSDYQPFLDKVDAYYDVLLPKLRPLLCTNGGPIIAMQIENEYGSYGNDVNYLNYLKESMISRGIDVLLFTSDGPGDFMLNGGMVPGVLETVNFGTKPTQSFATLREYQPDGPLMCMEYWNGWFDHWGTQHHTRDAKDVAAVLDEMLAIGASVNFYMFHGGTNFGFMNGANNNDGNSYKATTTSYDYDSPISECGDLTEKYYAIRDVVGKYLALPSVELPAPIHKKAYGEVFLDKQAGLFESLSKLSSGIRSTKPEPMEFYGQDYGFIMYTTTVIGPYEHTQLTLQHVRDRALIYLDDVYQGVIDRMQNETSLLVDIPKRACKLTILVENMGRTNYGPYLCDRKGITEGVRLGLQFLYNWTVHSLTLDDISQLEFTSIQQIKEQPVFYQGSFEVEDVADTFLLMEGWHKGIAYVNGFNLGRYFEIGPQQTLYIPAPLLRAGRNEITIFELHAANSFSPSVKLIDYPILG